MVKMKATTAKATTTIVTATNLQTRIRMGLLTSPEVGLRPLVGRRTVK
jgi:hypothetical protein